MLSGLREKMNKSPWMGWAFAGVLLLASLFMFFRSRSSIDPYSPARMQETVVIKFTDTGEEVEMTRGNLDREMRRSGDKLDSTKGVLNPKTGQYTGFPFDKNDWDQMIARINQEKQEFKKSPVSGATPAPSPRKELTPEESAKLYEKLAQPPTAPVKK